MSAEIDRTKHIENDTILGFLTVRNEIDRIAHFLEHHRSAGVGHFLIVDNSSTDGTFEFLRTQIDVSVWRTAKSYKLSRFGMDWLTWLLLRYGNGHWCLTLDADELFLAPFDGEQSLADLTAWLDRQGIRAVSAMMLELYPEGPIGAQDFRAGDNPLDILQWFDASGYYTVEREELGSRILRGGVRHREFFSSLPERSPTLNKLPLVKWHWRYAYLTSTHVILPPWLNRVPTQDNPVPPSAALLHTKFLPGVVNRAKEEKYRAEHFSNSSLYDAYYEAVASGPVLWCSESLRYEDWRQLERLGLISRGGWDPYPGKDGR